MAETQRPRLRGSSSSGLLATGGSTTSDDDRQPAARPSLLQSPRILSISWGRITVSRPSSVTEGIAGENIATSHRQQEETVVLKDAKLWPSGGVRAWDWSETGTRHNPGIQIADAEELLAGGATTVVLSRGMYMKLGVPDATVEALRARKVRVAPSEGGDDACEQGVAVEVIVAETREAVRIYNELVAKGVKVGGLFHSTC